MYKSNNVHSPDRADDKKRFEELIVSESERVKPMINEQLLREFVLGMGDTDEIFNIYCRAFDVDKNLPVRMAIIKPPAEMNAEGFFLIKNTVSRYITEETRLLSTIVNNFIVIITTLQNDAELTGALDNILMVVKTISGYSPLAVCSEISAISDAPATYERLRQCIEYSFYSDISRTIIESDIAMNKGGISLRPEYGATENAVKSGDEDKVKMLVTHFFKKLCKAAPAPAVAKTYCLELYFCIMRCLDAQMIERYMSGISTVLEAKSISEIQSFIEEKSVEITRMNLPEKQKIYSSLVRDTINIIDANIENENLSLRWLAGTILYTNVDYLGKLFKKETGKNFSHYVMEKRMEMAKDLLYEGKMDRIYEIAENVGYGSNSQYFSQVFKKYTGVSPLEYKEFARFERAKNN